MSESQNGKIVPKMAKLIYSLDSWHCPLSAFRLISGCCVTYVGKTRGNEPMSGKHKAAVSLCQETLGGEPISGNTRQLLAYVRKHEAVTV